MCDAGIPELAHDSEPAPDDVPVDISVGDFHRALEESHAVHLLQSGVAHPRKLCFDVDELVLRVAVLASDRGIERGLQLRRGGLDDFEIGEHTVRSKLTRDLGDERALAIVVEVVDRKSGYDEVELAERREVVAEVVLDHAHAIVFGEALTRLGEHWRRSIDRHHFRHVRTMLEHQGGQAAVAAAQIGHASRSGREELEERRFAREPVLEPTHSPQVLVDLLMVVPRGRWRTGIVVRHEADSTHRGSMFVRCRSDARRPGCSGARAARCSVSASRPWRCSWRRTSSVRSAWCSESSPTCEVNAAVCGSPRSQWCARDSACC